MCGTGKHPDGLIAGAVPAAAVAANAAEPLNCDRLSGEVGSGGKGEYFRTERGDALCDVTRQSGGIDQLELKLGRLAKQLL